MSAVYGDLLMKVLYRVRPYEVVKGSANKLYDKQKERGKIAKFCCDFKKLEKVADHYK